MTILTIRNGLIYPVEANIITTGKITPTKVKRGLLKYWKDRNFKDSDSYEVCGIVAGNFAIHYVSGFCYRLTEDLHI